MGNVLKSVALAAVMLALMAAARGVSAQESLSLTITPPFFQLSMGRGELWASSIRVVNTNNSDLTLYVAVADFEAKGEDGSGMFRFRPDAAEAPSTLSRWIETPFESVTIAPEQSAEIPFTIRVPDSAAPGGHYAAILVGVKPFSPASQGASVGISSYVSSLVFLRVHGDVKEEGRIREFTGIGRWDTAPEAEFSMRFENSGNVHLQPQGTITIKNMWGRVRGIVPINQGSEFGNVLPSSTRRFTFDWKGEGGALNIGRYKAVLDVKFGKAAEQRAAGTVTFWVIPVRHVASVAGGLIAACLAVVFLIRAYIRRSLRRFGIEAREAKVHPTMVADLRPPSAARATAGRPQKPRRRFIAIVVAVAALSIAAWIVISLT
jgi:hypothetical protein